MAKEPRKESKREGAFKHLMSPIMLGPIELKNRIALAPMNETMSGVNGEATEQMLAYFAARAKGGAALVSTGAVMGTRLASEFVWGRNLYLFHQGHMQGLGMLTERIHYFGAKAAIQMTIGFGRQGHSYDHHKLCPAPTAGLPYELVAEKAPRGVLDAWSIAEYPRYFLVGQMTREMTVDEIRSEQKEFAMSCQLALIAGFDVIEIHAPHGYLEHQFLSPLTNKRTDMYGGEWRNRKRFLLEVAEQIRYACPGVAVGVRISAEEHMQGGLTEDDMIDVAKDLQAVGIDYLSLSDGAGYEEGGHLVTDMDRSKHIPEHGQAFKKALKIPVIVASQHDPVKIEENIAKGKYDIQALGRQLFIDPEYPNKVAAGKIKEIVRCKRCNTCLIRCLAGLTPACPDNPNFGREYTLDEYRIGPWQKHEPILPDAMLRASMPALDRPWWKKELGIIEKSWRPLRGRTPR
ncbi:MAG: NADH:flavin oxidoreductase [Deltaproteobacteria bacterium]|nr:NADH:flavin oxidoreductase [Deltaproteobacteria bacterium]